MIIRLQVRLASAILALALIGNGGILMAQDVVVEKVAEGLVFPEGPVWHPDGYLVFSDVHGATIERLKPDGGTETWFNVGKKTNGLIMNNDGRKILACCFSERELLEIDAKSREYRVLSNQCDGREFNNVNDVAVDAEGNVFFSDPKWGDGSGVIQGVYRYTVSGKTELAARIEQQPNGLVVSPDQKWLYVARSGANDVWRFRRGPGGVLSEGGAWANLEPDAEPDGMTVDSKGNLYVAQAGNGKLCVISPEGTVCHLVKVCERMATNCEFHGGDESVLYVTGGGKQGQRTGCVWRLIFPK